TFHVTSRHACRRPSSCLCPNQLRQHGPLYRLGRHRGGAAHHHRNGLLVPLRPIEEDLTPPPLMDERQAIALILVLSIGLWALIWGLIIALQALLTWMF